MTDSSIPNSSSPDITLPSVDPTPPPPLSLSDILNSVEVLQQKEAEDKAKLESIGTASAESLRPALITWATRGLPNAFPILEVAIQPPAQCSDGVVRSLSDYIVFCTGQTIESLVAQLQPKLTGMVVSFANLGHAIGIVVSRA